MVFFDGVGVGERKSRHFFDAGLLLTLLTIIQGGHLLEVRGLLE